MYVRVLVYCSASSRVFLALICPACPSIFKPLSTLSWSLSSVLRVDPNPELHQNTFLLPQVHASGLGPRVPPSAICHCALLFCLILALGSDVENIPVGSLTGTPLPPFLPPTHTRTSFVMKISLSSTRVRSPPNVLKKSSSSDWKSAVLNKTCRNTVSCGPSVVSSTLISPQQSIRLTLI